MTDIKRIRELLEKATPGPWSNVHNVLITEIDGEFPAVASCVDCINDAQDEIIAAAREASNTGSSDELTGDAIQRFANILLAKQREKDAQIAETPISGEQDDITMQAKDRIAAAIRGQE